MAFVAEPRGIISGKGRASAFSRNAHQMSGSVDSTLRLLDLADEGRFLLMSHE
jgi:hypothetical protein